MQKNKLIVSLIIVAIVAGGIGFYAGKASGASSATPSFRGTAGTGSFAGRTGGAGRFGGGAGGGAVAGQVIAKDSKSITVQLPQAPGGTTTNGTTTSGSKIIYYSPTTQVMHTTAGTIANVAVGDQIFVNGTANSDGSVTADSIQIRPIQLQSASPATPTSTK